MVFRGDQAPTIRNSYIVPRPEIKAAPEVVEVLQRSSSGFKLLQSWRGGPQLFTSTREGIKWSGQQEMSDFADICPFPWQRFKDIWHHLDGSGSVSAAALGGTGGPSVGRWGCACSRDQPWSKETLCNEPQKLPCIPVQSSSTPSSLGPLAGTSRAGPGEGQGGLGHPPSSQQHEGNSLEASNSFFPETIGFHQDVPNGSLPNPAKAGRKIKVCFVSHTLSFLQNE